MDNNPIALTDPLGLKVDDCWDPSAASSGSAASNGAAGMDFTSMGFQGGNTAGQNPQFQQVLDATRQYYGTNNITITSNFTTTSDGTSYGTICISNTNLSVDGGGYSLDLLYINGQWQYKEQTSGSVIDGVYYPGKTIISKDGLPEFIVVKDSPKENKVEPEVKVWNYEDEGFWETEPYYTKEDVIEEIKNRAVGLGSGINKIIKILQRRSLLIDPTKLLNQKLEYAIKGRLKALGKGNAIRVKIIEDGKVTKIRYIEYQGQDENGNDIWIDRVEDLNML